MHLKIQTDATIPSKITSARSPINCFTFARYKCEIPRFYVSGQQNHASNNNSAGSIVFSDDA
jgi:hypothetical protein